VEEHGNFLDALAATQTASTVYEEEICEQNDEAT
jgi:hypothetical protein